MSNYTYSEINASVCKETTSVLVATIKTQLSVPIRTACNTPQLGDPQISREWAHSGKRRWRKKISAVCLTGRKACLLRIYWRPRFGGGHACENITTVILPRSYVEAGLGCAGPGLLNTCRSSTPGAAPAPLLPAFLTLQFNLVDVSLDVSLPPSSQLPMA